MKYILLLIVLFVLIQVTPVFSQTLGDYISETRGDTLVIKTQAEMGGAANALFQVLFMDTISVPAGRVYMLKAGGVYPLQNNPNTYANRTTRIVGSDPTPLVNNKNAASSLPLICGYVGSDTTTGGINAGGNLEIRNVALSPCAPNGTEGWDFTGVNTANIHITFDNCLFEHTYWVEMYSGNAGCSFFVSNSYFVNLNGYPCRRNGGVYDGFANMDTIWFENCTYTMAQGTLFRWRNYTAQRININHNTFVNCAGYTFMDLGTQVNVNYTNNLFVNCNVQPYSGTMAFDPSEVDLDNLPMGFVNVYPDATLEANHTPRKFLVEGNNLFWSPYLSNVADTCNQIQRDGRTTWTSQMILMNTRTQGMFDNDYKYPYLTEGKQYAVDPQFTNPRNLFGDQLTNLKTFAVSTVDNASTAVLPDWRLVNTGASNYIYFDWPIPVDLSYTNETLLTGATNGFPVGDLNWLPTQKAQWLAQRTAEYTAIQNALDNGTTTIFYVNFPTPQNLTATAGVGQVTLMWNKNTGADFLRYRIYRGTASGAEILSDSSSNSISDTTKVVTGLSNGTTYFFRITAVNNSGIESRYSNEVSAMPNPPMSDYISATKGDTLVIKTQAEMGGTANALYQVLQLDNVNVPAGRVYMLKAGGVYPLQNYPTTYANRTTRIVGSDPTPLANNKNAASSLPLICGNIGSGTYPGGINAGGNLEVRNCALECAANDGTEGWAFTGTSAANLHVTFDNCLFEHTLWTELAGSTNNNGCSFFVSNCYFVNLNGQPCRRNGGVYDGFANMDTMWVENCTHIMTQGSMYKWRNYTAQRININHNTFVNCAGSQFMDLGTQVNVNYTNNLFVNCNVQPFPGIASIDPGEIDLDMQPMGFVNVYPDSTLEANHTPRKFLVEGNNLFWSPYLSNVVDTCNQIRRDGKTGWQSQMILMNTRTKAMFNNNTQYPYLTEGKQYAVDPQFTNPRNLFGDQLANLKTFAVSTVDTSNNNWAVLPDWRLVNTGSSNYVYFDWPIPVDLSYNNATLLTGATNGFPVGDINWFPTQKAQWLAQRTAEYTAIQNALNNGTTTISNIILPPPTSWNFASITGKNASIAVPTSINPRIGCQSLQTGDAVGVFFVRNDSLICGGYSIWQAGQNMAITAWGDNTQTTLKDGFADGELIQFKIWDSQAGREYNATAQYSTGGTTYTTNGIYALSSLVGISSIYHSISLPQGWNMISSFVAPKDSTIDTLFSKIKNHMVLMKDGFGMVYWPSMSINNIGKWNPENGYQIYMQTSDTLTMFGNEINPQQTPMALSQGWSMVSYLRNSPMRSDSALVSLGSNVVIAKNGAGQVYWPAYTINQIGSMRPGQGYQMYLSGAGTLTYPANVTSAPPSMLTKTPNLLATTSDQVPKHYKVSNVNTGSNAIVLVKTQDAKDGDEVAVLNASKVVIGSGVVKSGQVAVTVWGDNTLTPDVVEGAKDGEELSLTLWTNADQTEKNLTVTALTDALVNKDGRTDLKYKENQVLIATTNIVANNIPKEFLLCQNYPNPFNPTTTLEFGVPVDSKVKVEVYNILGQLIAVLVDEVRQAGYYKVTFGSQSMPSGVYFYRMTAGSFVQTKKMQLIK